MLALRRHFEYSLLFKITSILEKRVNISEFLHQKWFTANSSVITSYDSSPCVSYTKNKPINKLCYWLKIPFSSYTHTTGLIHLKVKADRKFLTGISVVFEFVCAKFCAQVSKNSVCLRYGATSCWVLEPMWEWQGRANVTDGPSEETEEKGRCHASPSYLMVIYLFAVIH